MLGRLFRQGGINNSAPINSTNVPTNSTNGASSNQSGSSSYDDCYTRSILYGTQNVNQLRVPLLNPKLFRIIVSQDGCNLRSKQILFDSANNDNLPKPSKKLFSKLHHNTTELNDFMFGCSLPSNELCSVTKIHILPPLNSIYGQYHSVLVTRLFSITNDENSMNQLPQRFHDWSVSSTLPVNSSRNHYINSENPAKPGTNSLNSRFSIGIIIPIELLDDLQDMIFLNWTEISYYLINLQKLIYKKLLSCLNLHLESTTTSGQSPYVINKRIQFPNHILQQEADLNQQVSKLVKLFHFITLPKLINSNCLIRLTILDAKVSNCQPINSLLVNWVMEVLNWLTFKDGNDGFLPSLLALILPIRSCLANKPFQPVKSSHRELTRIVIMTGNPMIVKKLVFILNGLIPNDNLLSLIQIENINANNESTKEKISHDSVLNTENYTTINEASDRTFQASTDLDFKPLCESFPDKLGIKCKTNIKSNVPAQSNISKIHRKHEEQKLQKPSFSSNLTNMHKQNGGYSDGGPPLNNILEHMNYTSFQSSNPIKFLQSNQLKQANSSFQNPETNYDQIDSITSNFNGMSTHGSSIKPSNPINIRSGKVSTEDMKRKSSVASGISPSNIGIPSSSVINSNGNNMTASKPIFIKKDEGYGSPTESENYFNRSTPSVKGWEIPGKSTPSTTTTPHFSSIETTGASQGIPISTPVGPKAFPQLLSKLSSMAYLSTSLNSSLSSSASKYSLSNLGGSFLEKWKNSLGSYNNNQTTPSHTYDEYMPPPNVGKRNSFQSFRSPSPAMENDEFNWHSSSISLSSSVGGSGSPITPTKLSRTQSMHDLYNMVKPEDYDESQHNKNGVNLDLKRSKSGVYNPLINDNEIKNVFDHNRNIISKKCHSIMYMKINTKQDAPNIIEVNCAEDTANECTNTSNVMTKYKSLNADQSTITPKPKSTYDKANCPLLKLQGLNPSIAFCEEFRPEFNLLSCPTTPKLEQQIMTTMKQDLLFYQNNFQYEKITTRTILISLRSREIKTIEMKINNQGIYSGDQPPNIYQECQITTMNGKNNQSNSPKMNIVPVTTTQLNNTYRTKIKKVFTPTKNSGDLELTNSIEKILEEMNHLVNSYKNKDGDFHYKLTNLVSELLNFSG